MRIAKIILVDKNMSKYCKGLKIQKIVKKIHCESNDFLYPLAWLPAVRAKNDQYIQSIFSHCRKRTYRCMNFTKGEIVNNTKHVWFRCNELTHLPHWSLPQFIFKPCISFHFMIIFILIISFLTPFCLIKFYF